MAAPQVTGVWTLRKDCLARLVSEKAYEPSPDAIHQIDLRPDGTCRFRSVLQYPARYMDRPGTWKLTQGAENTTSLDLSIEEKGHYALRLDFTELFGPIELFEYWGDPDACEILRYEKTGQPIVPAD